MNEGNESTESGLPPQIPQSIHVCHWHHRRPLGFPLLAAAYARQHGQGAAQPALDAEPNIGVEAIADHAGAGAVKAELTLNGVHHGRAGLAERDGRPLLTATEHGDERRRPCTRARKQGVCARERDVRVGSEEDGGALRDVMVCECVLTVAGVEVESGEDDTDGRVQSCAGGDRWVVGWNEGLKEAAVGAANVGNGFRVKFGFDSGLP